GRRERETAERLLHTRANAVVPRQVQEAGEGVRHGPVAAQPDGDRELALKEGDVPAAARVADAQACVGRAGDALRDLGGVASPGLDAHRAYPRVTRLDGREARQGADTVIPTNGADGRVLRVEVLQGCAGA